MNVTNLKRDVHVLAGTTSGSYPDADLMRNVNVHYKDVARTIWESDGTWSGTGGEDSTYYRTLANASASYLIPTQALRIKQVEVQDGSGQWQKLQPINYDELSISPEEYLDSVGTPLRYHLEGTQIRLFPAPGTGYATMTSGMAVRLDPDVTDLAVTATTAEPSFPAAFHRILSLGAALDVVENNEDRNFLLNQKERLMTGLVRFYAKRWNEGRSQIRPKSKRFWRQYT